MTVILFITVMLLAGIIGIVSSKVVPIGIHYGALIGLVAGSLVALAAFTPGGLILSIGAVIGIVCYVEYVADQREKVMDHVRFARWKNHQIISRLHNTEIPALVEIWEDWFRYWKGTDSLREADCRRQQSLYQSKINDILMALKDLEMSETKIQPLFTWWKKISLLAFLRNPNREGFDPPMAAGFRCAATMLEFGVPPIPPDPMLKPWENGSFKVMTYEEA